MKVCCCSVSLWTGILSKCAIILQHMEVGLRNANNHHHHPSQVRP